MLGTVASNVSTPEWQKIFHSDVNIEAVDLDELQEARNLKDGEALHAD